MEPSQRPVMSLRAYARHRRSLGLPGATPTAVHKAVRTGRLAESLVNGRIPDAKAADAEWHRNTLAHMGPLHGRTSSGPVRWWRILGRNLHAVAATLRREAKRQARLDRATLPTFRERRKAEGGCTKCLLPATDGVHCAKHAEQ